MAIKQNILANFVGQGWRLLMSIAFVPIYIKYLGIESYGLIGIFAMLQAWMILLDMGIRPALSREMAKFTGGFHDSNSIWRLLRSVEVIILFLSIFLAFTIFSLSDFFAENWVNNENLDNITVADAFILMGVIFAIQFYENIYLSSLGGLQKQVAQNVVITLAATLRGIGSVGVLVFWSPTIQAFFLWHIFVSIISLSLFICLVYCYLPSPTIKPRFSPQSLLDIANFSLGMLGITFLSLLLTQVDKLLLSGILTLKDFGYYSLAGMIALCLHIINTPISNAFYPRFTELLTQRNKNQLNESFHLGAQLSCVVVGSAGIVLFFFTDRLIYMWTGDLELTNSVSPILKILGLGTSLNCLMWIPYQMQLAYGWTALAIRVNIVSILILIPAIFLVVPIYGGIGAAWIWVILNCGYIFFGMHFMFKKILRKQKYHWMVFDLLFPIICGCVMAGFLKIFLPEFSNRLYELFSMLLTGLSILLIMSLSAKSIRERIFFIANKTINRLNSP